MAEVARIEMLLAEEEGRSGRPRISGGGTTTCPWSWSSSDLLPAGGSSFPFITRPRRRLWNWSKRKKRRKLPRDYSVFYIFLYKINCKKITFQIDLVKKNHFRMRGAEMSEYFCLDRIWIRIHSFKIFSSKYNHEYIWKSGYHPCRKGKLAEYLSPRVFFRYVLSPRLTLPSELSKSIIGLDLIWLFQISRLSKEKTWIPCSHDLNVSIKVKVSTLTI